MAQRNFRIPPELHSVLNITKIDPVTTPGKVIITFVHNNKTRTVTLPFTWAQIDQIEANIVTAIKTIKGL